MKKTIIVLAIILVGLAVLLPLASTNPDVMDAVTDNLSTGQQSSIWQGIMPDYSASVGNGYTSTLIAGIIGVIIVVIAGLVVGKALAPKKQ
jgi:hypothetical protein